MLERLCSLAAIVIALALFPMPTYAQPVGACPVLIQFYNEGTPGSPGVSGDNRFGVRLDIPDIGPILLPADYEGYVRFFITDGTVIPFSYVRMYLDPLADLYGTPAEAGCGFTAIRVAAGT